MKLPITPNRDFLKRMKKAHQFRALLKHPATAPRSRSCASSFAPSSTPQGLWEGFDINGTEA